MVHNRIDLTGKRFGRLKVLRQSRARFGHGELKWVCRCGCGRVKDVPSGHLRKGAVRSCGCYKIEKQTKHGHCKRGKVSLTRRSWAAMRQRCNNPKNPAYKDYGGRGITVCARWNNSFINFLSDMGERPPGLTLERKNNNKGYYKRNCKWATRSEQQYNRRNSLKNRIGPTGTQSEYDGS